MPKGSEKAKFVQISETEYFDMIESKIEKEQQPQFKNRIDIGQII